MNRSDQNKITWFLESAKQFRKNILQWGVSSRDDMDFQTEATFWFIDHMKSLETEIQKLDTILHHVTPPFLGIGTPTPRYKLDIGNTRNESK